MSKIIPDDLFAALLAYKQATPGGPPESNVMVTGHRLDTAIAGWEPTRNEMPTNEQVEEQRQAILALLRENPDGLTVAMLEAQSGLDVHTLTRRLRILRNRRVVDEVAGVWFVAVEVADV